VVVSDEPLPLRALEIYEQYRIHFTESYLVACAELAGVGVVASDRDGRCVSGPSWLLAQIGNRRAQDPISRVRGTHRRCRCNKCRRRGHKNQQTNA